MARPKNPEPEKNWLTELMEEHEREEAKVKAFPLLAERWYVDEKLPDWHEHSIYDSGTWHTGKTNQVSPIFKTEAEVDQWLEDHIPEEGAKFFKRHQYLREHTKTWKEWGWV